MSAPYHWNVIRHAHVFNFMGYTITDKVKVVYPSKTHKKSYFDQMNFASPTLPHADTLLASIYSNSNYCIKQNQLRFLCRDDWRIFKEPFGRTFADNNLFLFEFSLVHREEGKGRTRLSCKSKDQQFHYCRQHLKNNCDKDTNLRSGSIFVSLCK